MNQRIKTLENLVQNFNIVEMTLDEMTSSKMLFTDKDGQYTKGKHDTAHQLLKEYAQKLESSVIKSFSEKLINSVLFDGGCRQT